MFINREAELAQLEHLYSSDHAELFVLYGRRRVGKTELLRAFCAEKPHVFFIATLSSDSDQLATFSQAIWGMTHTTVPEGFTFPGWEAAFRALADLPGRPVVILDEFTYLMTGNQAIPSILQKVWDETLRHTRVFLVLCGSYIGMMEREVLAYQAPLYGRRTGSIFLNPLDLPATAVFFPSYTAIQAIETWAVLGGMPYYLHMFSDKVDVLANVRAQILNAQGPLYYEPQLLLMQELREPRNYFSILRAIAHGHTRLNEIAQAAGVGNAATTGRYLDILQQLRVVRRIVPATESRPEKSRKGLYQIADAFLRFWFRYVHPYQGSLDLGLADAILAQRIRPTFEQFVSYAFEEAAREYLARQARQGTLPFLPERIGSWWDQQSEIDVIMISDTDRCLLLGECKWSVNPVGVNVLEDLQRNAAPLLALGPWRTVTYALFAKSGFTPALRDLALEQGVQLITVEQMLLT